MKALGKIAENKFRFILTLVSLCGDKIWNACKKNGIGFCVVKEFFFFPHELGSLAACNGVLCVCFFEGGALCFVDFTLENILHGDYGKGGKEDDCCPAGESEEVCKSRACKRTYKVYNECKYAYKNYNVQHVHTVAFRNDFVNECDCTNGDTGINYCTKVNAQNAKGNKREEGVNAADEYVKKGKPPEESGKSVCMRNVFSFLQYCNEHKGMKGQQHGRKKICGKGRSHDICSNQAFKQIIKTYDQGKNALV